MSTSQHVDIAKDNAMAGLVISKETFVEVPEEVECPQELEHIWGFFRELDARRSNSGMGFCPIDHVQITAWSEGMQIGITPFERSCVVAIDDAYRLHCNTKEKKHG